MKYQLYIFNANAKTKTARDIRLIQSTIHSLSKEDWDRNNIDTSLVSFDAEAVKSQIESTIPGKCIVFVRHPPAGCLQTPFLAVVTSYQAAKDVLPWLHAIANSNQLVLFDAELDRAYFKNLIDEPFITVKSRAQVLRSLIVKEMQPIFVIRKFFSSLDSPEKEIAFVVTLRKSPEADFRIRTLRFYNLLENSLEPGETLCLDDSCFTVCGEGYSICFCLEAYKKHAEFVGVGLPDKKYPATVWLLHRMNFEAAWKYKEQLSEQEQVRLMGRMHLEEMQRKYPNPADRFVASVRITKWLGKQPFVMSYSHFHCYNENVRFHIVPDTFYQDEDTDEISALSFDDAGASFIIPFVNDEFPDIYNRYYEKSHIPMEMMKRIVERIKNARDWVLHDTFGEALKPYIDSFSLYSIGSFDEYMKHEDCTTEHLYNHRFEVARLYSAFIEWAETQFDMYTSEWMFSIQGP